MRYTTASTPARRSGRSASRGTRYGMPASRILALARTSRWAIVGSATRKAAAISAVVSPPSRRSVRATRASMARAGWQHVKIRRSRSSRHGTLLVGDVGAGGHQPRRLSLAVVARRLAPPPVDRPVAGGGDDPPGGTGGHPRRRPPLDGHGERILDRLLGGADVTERSDQRRHHPAVLLAEHPLDRRPGHGTAVDASGTGGVGGPALRRRVRRLGHGSPRRGRPR